MHLDTIMASFLTCLFILDRQALFICVGELYKKPLSYTGAKGLYYSTRIRNLQESCMSNNFRKITIRKRHFLLCACAPAGALLRRNAALECLSSVRLSLAAFPCVGACRLRIDTPDLYPPAPALRRRTVGRCGSAGEGLPCSAPAAGVSAWRLGCPVLQRPLTEVVPFSRGFCSSAPALPEPRLGGERSSAPARASPEPRPTGVLLLGTGWRRSLARRGFCYVPVL